MARWGHGNLELSSFGGGEVKTKKRMSGDTETENSDPRGTVSSEGLTQVLLWSAVAAESDPTGNGCQVLSHWVRVSSERRSSQLSQTQM